jgi:hypothetical protein
MKKFHTVLVLLMVSVSFVNAQPAFEQRSLEEALNPDGTLKRGVQGSFKVEGYTMRTGKHGEPIFVPQTQNTASGTWSTLGTGSQNGVNGFVYALAVVGNEVYVGGSFTSAGGVSANHVARFNTQTNTWSTLGTGSSNGVNYWVYALAVVGNEVVVGGYFGSAGGVSANNVARFNTLTNTWSPLGTGSQNGVNYYVYALAVVGNEVFVGGAFTSAGGVSANYVARFNTQTNTWSALGTGSSNGVNYYVNALAVVGNEVVVGGEFTSAGGVSANRVARFNTQTNTWSTLGTGSQNGVNNNVFALAVVGNEVVVGGSFTSAGGVSANRVARFNTQTNTWSALGTGSQNGVNNNVFALAVVGNEVVVGGEFTSAGGVSANRVARFNTQTNTWSALTGSQNGVSGGSGSGGYVNALAVVGNEVVVGGNFTLAGGVSANNVARFNTQTNTWSPLGSSNGVSNTVRALAVVGNEVVVGGYFTSAGGVSANHVARFNTQTNTWSALGTGSSNGVNYYVNALAVVGNEVYVGGDFTQAGGVSANYVARFNTQTNTWSALGTGSQNGVNNTVRALAVVGNEVYVGGWFTSAGGVSANRVARFNTQTNTWSTLGTGSSNGVNNVVRALAVVGNEVVVGGSFTSAGGVSANYVARFNTQTNTWSPLGTGSQNGVSGGNSSVDALAVVGNEVVVGGGFTSAGGVSANYVARFNTQTNTWSALGTGSSNGVNYYVNALAVVGNEVVVGGNFTSAGGVSANYVARFNTQTNTWSTLGTGSSNGVSGSVDALAVVGNEVYVGGGFTSAGGVSANYVARYSPPTNNPPTHTISGDGLYLFPPTGVSIFFTGVSGTGTCTVQRFDAPASNISFIGTPPTFTSQYRFVITASAFTFTSAELRFNRTQIPNAGITNAGTVSVYRRPTPGTGAFSILPNTFNASFPDEVRATTTAFSEFLLGSNDPDNPLPVELVSFRGTATAQGVQLTWQTATELNNAGFEVRRKTAGEDFVTIASYRFDPSLRGKGTTSSTTTYSFVDATVEAGKTYTYRLRSVDYDGTIHDYAQTVSVEVREPVQARVYEYALEQNYPNPFNPTTTIRYSLKETGKVSVRVYDVMGREVKVLVDRVQGAGEYSVVMDATGLSSGVYVYQLRAGGLLLTRKMVLVK